MMSAPQAVVSGTHPPRLDVPSLEACLHGVWLWTTACQCLSLPGTAALQHRMPMGFPLVCVQVRVYELGQLGMKFERHLDSEVVDFQVSTS